MARGLKPRGRFTAAGKRWRVRPVKGPLYDRDGARVMCRVDWKTRRLVYDESLEKTPAVLAQATAVAVGIIWGGRSRA